MEFVVSDNHNLGVPLLALLDALGTGFPDL